MRKPLKLLYATCFLDMSGVTRINFDILNELGPDWEIHVCVTEPDGRVAGSCHNQFAEQFREPLKLWQSPGRERYRRFLEYLKTHGIGLVYVTHSLWLYEHAARLKRDLPGVRIIDSLHVLEPYCFRGGYPDISANRFVHPFLDQSIVISQHLREYLLRNYPVQPEKLTVVHNGIDADRFRRECGVKPPGIAGAGKVVGFVGRLTVQKRPLLVIDIARELCRRDPELSLYLVGEGALRAKVERRIARYRLQDRVQMLGTRDDIPSLLNATDLLLLPSAYEGAPLTILEALSVGVPVVASDVGAVKEYVNERCRLIPLGRGGAAECRAYAAAALACLADGKGAGALLPAHRLDQVVESYRAVFAEALQRRG
jgi:glycosyltransferase involved in cell wall biosynthesis